MNNALKQYGYSGGKIDYTTYLSNTDALKEAILTWEDNGNNYRLLYSYHSNTRCTFVIEETGEHEISSIAQDIKDSVAKWYYTVRNIALVIMMPVLVYIGIRMMLTSVSNEKAKYKNMLTDWIIAICLIFVMQYIMSFSMNIVETITDLVSKANERKQYASIIYDEDNKIEKALKEEELWDDELKDDDGNIVWPSNNIMGLIRTQAAEVESGSIVYLGYTMAFLILVWYTIFFLFTYIKRIIYLAFLTIIAPLVAMTYPIDKINDGKAQAFDMWLKEYIFNLLIQPFHLLLYTVLITMAFELASTNIIYTLVAIGFMVPAEKLLRRFFGFEKAQTPGVLGGAAGAALMMNGLNQIFRRAPRRGGKSDSKNKEEDEENTGIFTNTSDINDKHLFDNGEKSDEGAGTFLNSGGGDLGNSPINPMEKTTGSSSIILGGNNNINRASLNSDSSKSATDLITQGINFSPETAKWIAERKASGNTPKLQTSQSQPIKKTVKAPKPNPSRFRGFKQAAKEYRRMGVDSAIKNIKKRADEPVRSLNNMLTGAAVGATTGLLGASFGIASGDLSKVGQYGVAGAAGGYALASRGRQSEIDAERLAEEYQKGMYGDMEEYKKAEMEKAREEFMNNDKKMKELQEKMNYKSEEEAKKKMEEYSKFLDAGFRDTDDIATMIKMVEEEGWSEEKAMTVAKFSNKLPARPSKLGKKETEELNFKCRNIAEANNAPDIEAAVKQIKANAELYGKTKGNLNEVE